MRRLVIATAISLSFALVPAPAEESGLATPYKQGQSAPVQPDRTPQQSDQSRGQERARGEMLRLNATGRPRKMNRYRSRGIRWQDRRGPSISRS